MLQEFGIGKVASSAAPDSINITIEAANNARLLTRISPNLESFDVIAENSFGRVVDQFEYENRTSPERKIMLLCSRPCGMKEIIITPLSTLESDFMPS